MESVFQAVFAYSYSILARKQALSGSEQRMIRTVWKGISLQTVF
jgi:hypothetical protein